MMPLSMTEEMAMTRIFVITFSSVARIFVITLFALIFVMTLFSLVFVMTLFAK